MDDHWNLLNVGWYRRTGDGVVLEVNDAELSILDYSRDEMVGHHVSEFMAAELVPLLSEHIDGYNEGNQRLIMTMGLRKDGATVPLLDIFNRRELREDGSVEFVEGLHVTLERIWSARQLGAGPAELAERLHYIALELELLARSSGGATRHLLNHPGLADLSPREKDVLSELLAGARVGAIANDLHISPSTVRSHLRSLFSKLGVSSQSELVQHVRSLSGEI